MERIGYSLDGGSMMNEDLIKVPFHRSELLVCERRDFELYVADICSRGMFTNSKYLELLEREIAEISNREYAVVFSSGTAALFCAIKAMEIEGIVLTTPLTWVATSNAIEANLKTFKIFYDVDENGMLEIPEPPPGFSVQDIEDTYGGIMSVSLYGQQINHKMYDPYRCLPMILDACHSVNQLDILDVDRTFDIMCFSLHPTKLFFAGEGGFAVTDRQDLVEKMKMFRYQGLNEEKLRQEISIKFSMPELSAACAYATIRNFGERVLLQKEKINRYLEAFDEATNMRHQMRIISDENCTMMTIAVHEAHRDPLISLLRNAGYYADIKYPHLLYLSQCEPSTNYPMTRKLAKEIITLPCFPTMKDKSIREIVKVIEKYLMKM